MRWLKSKGFGDRPFKHTRSVPITQNGLESLAAQFFRPAEQDPRVDLMGTLGRAYRKTEKMPDDGDVERDISVQAAFDHIRKALPHTHEATAGRPSRVCPQPGSSRGVRYQRRSWPRSATPWLPYPGQRRGTLLGDDAGLCDIFRPGPRAARWPAALPPSIAQGGPPVPLRDLHAAAIVAGMRRARPRRL